MSVYATDLEEHEIVWLRRFGEAREAGMEFEDAVLFARNETDIAVLRGLVANKCPPRLIARIVL